MELKLYKPLQQWQNNNSEPLTNLFNSDSLEDRAKIQNDQDKLEKYSRIKI